VKDLAAARVRVKVGGPGETCPEPRPYPILPKTGFQGQYATSEYPEDADLRCFYRHIPYRHLLRLFMHVIETLGAEKCLYGTDGPYADATQRRMLDRILQLSLSDNERDQILGRNFLELIEA
jgi:hypothetical protein